VSGKSFKIFLKYLMAIRGVARDRIIQEAKEVKKTAKVSIKAAEERNAKLAEAEAEPKKEVAIEGKEEDAEEKKEGVEPKKEEVKEKKEESPVEDATSVVEERLRRAKKIIKTLE
jgi:hypothetical protein